MRSEQVNGPRPGGSAPELTIGIIGPHDLVERIMLMGHGGSTLLPSSVPSRLIAAAYRDEQEATDKVARLGTGIDVCLFASPLPYEYARKSGALTMPATYIPLNGGALHSTLLRAAIDERFDPARASIDVLGRAEVEEAYTEIGLPPDGVHVREEAATPAAVAAFHERLWRRGATTVALTGVHSVSERLRQTGVPTLRMRPTGAAIRTSLQTAALLGAHHRLEDAQLAIVMIDVPTLRDASRRSAPRYWRDELRLSINRILVQECQRMHATVWPVDDHTFLVTATRGSTAAASEGFRTPPFVERVRSELGVAIEVGVGMGRTAQDAESHARSALARTQATRQAQGFAVDREGRALVPTPRVPPRASPARRPKGLDVLSRLAERMSDREGPLVVDAESAGEMLDVTPRTARRLLRTLVEEGLAWPLPPNRTPQPGRPRQLYRLIVEKLEPESQSR